MFILKSLHDLGIFGHATAWGTPRNDIAGPGGQAHLHQQAQQFANSFLIRKKNNLMKWRPTWAVLEGFSRNGVLELVFQSTFLLES